MAFREFVAAGHFNPTHHGAIGFHPAHGMGFAARAMAPRAAGSVRGVPSLLLDLQPYVALARARAGRPSGEAKKWPPQKRRGGGSAALGPPGPKLRARAGAPRRGSCG